MQVSENIEVDKVHASVQVNPTFLHMAVQHPLRKVSYVECGTQTDMNFMFNVNDSDDNSYTSDSDSDISDSIYAPSSTEEEEEEKEFVSELTPNSKSPIVMCLAYESCIHELLKFCPLCGSVVTDSLKTWYDGTMLLVKGSCLSGCDFSWTSQPTISVLDNRSGKGNFELAASIMVCGGTYGLVQGIANCLGLSIFSHTTYDIIQRDFVAPVVFNTWNTQQTLLIQEMTSRSSIRLAGDGRSNSPGFSAKYLTYSLLDCDNFFVVRSRI